MHSVKKLDKSRIEIEGELSAEDFGKYRERAVKNIGARVDIDGFRKGLAPEHVLISKVGEMTVLEEMAELALGELYPSIVTGEKLDVIGAPEIAITKIGKGSALGFKITSTILPELTLPNYKRIAAEVMAGASAIEVTDADVETTLTEIRKQRAPLKDEKGDPVLPELTNEFAKSLGDFQGLDDLRKKLKENLGEEKKFRAKEKKRLDILERLAAETKADIPELLVNAESEKMLSRLRGDLERVGLKFDDYLKNVGKTEDDIRGGWKGEAEKRAKIELILLKIAEIENIKPTEEELEKEVKHVLEHYKDAKEERVRDYVASVIQNEKVLEFLEQQT